MEGKGIKSIAVGGANRDSKNEGEEKRTRRIYWGIDK